MRKITVIIAGCILLTGLFLAAYAEDAQNEPAGQSESVVRPLEKSTVYNSIVEYLQKVDDTSWEQGGLEQGVFYFVVDLFFSFFCLWVSLWLFTREIKLVFRRYFWFIFFFNLSWFCMLVFLKGVWMVLDYLVIRLQPDTIGVVLNNYISAVFVIALIIYVWILARTFGLTSLTAVGTLAVSHLFYLTIIFLVLSFAFPAESPQFNAVRNYFGFKPIVYGYLSDIEKAVSGNNILDFVRIRPFHL
ncbi:MAG: hypothetical protein PHC33_00200 [Candidatus Omnitrophica bacterium]|nr:hypothetical protein [Candidatus Omnitrophota bacterium]